MGPKFVIQNFPHIILERCYFMHFGELLLKKLHNLNKTAYFTFIELLLLDIAKMSSFIQIMQLFQ